MAEADATYLAVLEEALADAGREAAILSALDIQTLLSWRSEGIPLAHALKGIRQGLHVYTRTRRREDPSFPRRVAYFDTWVRRLHQQRRARVFVATPGVPGVGERPVAGQATGSPASEAGIPDDLRAWLREALTRGIPDRGAALRGARAELLAELEGQDANDADAWIAWAFAANQRLQGAALADLGSDEGAALRAQADARARARFPLASPEGLATKARLDLRRQLEDRGLVTFVDLRELSR